MFLLVSGSIGWALLTLLSYLLVVRPMLTVVPSQWPREVTACAVGWLHPSFKRRWFGACIPTVLAAFLALRTPQALTATHGFQPDVARPAHGTPLSAWEVLNHTEGFEVAAARFVHQTSSFDAITRLEPSRQTVHIARFSIRQPRSIGGQHGRVFSCGVHIDTLNRGPCILTKMVARRLVGGEHRPTVHRFGAQAVDQQCRSVLSRTMVMRPDTKQDGGGSTRCEEGGATTRVAGQERPLHTVNIFHDRIIDPSRIRPPVHSPSDGLVGDGFGGPGDGSGRTHSAQAAPSAVGHGQRSHGHVLSNGTPIQCR